MTLIGLWQRIDVKGKEKEKEKEKEVLLPRIELWNKNFSSRFGWSRETGRTALLGSGTYQVLVCHRQ